MSAETMHHAQPLLQIDDLHVRYRAGGRAVPAVRGVTLEIPQGGSLGLVGESGCGKTTLARAVLRLEAPEAGAVALDGVDVHTVSPAVLRVLRGKMQMVFQDPVGSLNPHMTAAGAIAEALSIHGLRGRLACRQQAETLLAQVGLQPDIAARYPHQLSGGQCQRVGIARALAAQPRLLVCDEPLSALDASAQLDILDLLRSLRTKHRMAFLFITHNLGIARALCESVAVMYAGEIVERGPATTILTEPRHPYTKALAASIPTLDPTRRPTLTPPLDLQIDNVPAERGCPFYPRCSQATAVCQTEHPKLVPLFQPGMPAEMNMRREVACHHAE